MIIRSKLLKLSSLCIIGATVLFVGNSGQDANGGVGNKLKNCLEKTKDGLFTSDDGDKKEVADNNNGNITSPKVGENGVLPDGTILPDNTNNADNIGGNDVALSKVAGSKEQINDVIPAKKGIASRKINLNDYKNVVISKSDTYLNIRSGPGENNGIVGKLPKNAGGFAVGSSVVDGVTWVKIKSGDVEGYVSGEYLYTGNEALNRVVQVGRYVIKVNCDTLNVREKPSTSSTVVCQISKGEELEVAGVDNGWVEVIVAVGKDTSYVAKEHVDIQFEIKTAIKVDDMMIGVSSVRTKIVEYAKQFLGNPYVYGGTSLTKGIDCSAYTQAIYKKFGYSLPRTAAQQSQTDTATTYDKLKPGDLVFYTYGGKVSHVAMYIGKVGGKPKIIHASNPKDGITISNMLYTTPYKYVNKVGD